MTHAELETQLDAYGDGELSETDVQAVEAHLAECPACVQLRDERRELRAELVARIPTFPAPDALRKRIEAAARGDGREDGRGAAPTPAVRRYDVRRWMRPLALAASLMIVAVGSWQVAARRGAADALTNELLASHVRSLMPGHLTDVVSTDQHTVKPWFNGRLDFSPPVYDFAGRGYPLLGGRLDYVDGRQVAALVYGRRQHLINVFVWPAGRDPGSAGSGRTRQGYHLLYKVAGDYRYWVVSDLGVSELQQFVDGLGESEAAAGSVK